MDSGMSNVEWSEWLEWLDEFDSKSQGKCTTDIKKLIDEGCRCFVCLSQLNKERSGYGPPLITDEWATIGNAEVWKTILPGIEVHAGDRIRSKTLKEEFTIDKIDAMVDMIYLLDSGGRVLPYEDLVDGDWEVLQLKIT